MIWYRPAGYRRVGSGETRSVETAPCEPFPVAKEAGDEQLSGKVAGTVVTLALAVPGGVIVGGVVAGAAQAYAVTATIPWATDRRGWGSIRPPTRSMWPTRATAPCR
jgi:hypothetical protein